MSTPQHSRLINAAAKAVLGSLGCVQKGRSRIWLDDHHWWVGVIEFQPSSWDKGSYLNVGACWLLSEKDHLSFDAGYRVGSFRPFKGDEQFLPVAQTLAEQAGQEVIGLRERFASPSRVQSWLAAKPPTSIWDHYHLAVAAGLAGATDQSRQAFADVASHPDDRPWAADIRRRSAELRECLEHGAGLEPEVMETVARTRALLKLPPRA